ncbi:zinc finger, CCHC-type containing protein [Tanacetum coccineum]
MFRLNIVFDNIRSAFMSTSKLNDSILWHARLGHVHFKRMQDMSKDGLIPAFDMDSEKCQTCMLNKITKKPFQNVKHETEVLELIQSDLCDLHATPLLENKKYFVTFIDDAFRFCYVYLLHSKDEALDKFKVFKTEVELQQGSLIKRFRTDRGCEYMDTLYFQSVGIIHETTAPYTPQQNGISERKNRVLKEMVNSMLSYFRLRTWDEVSDQHSYCFNVEDDPKTFDEAMKSQDVAFWKEASNDEMDSIMGNNTWVLTNLPPADKCVYIKFDASGKGVIICLYVDDMLIFGIDQVQVDLTKEFLLSRFSMKDMGEADCDNCLF